VWRRPAPSRASSILRRSTSASSDLQEYFRSKHAPTLAVWGKNDPFFLPPGAEAFRRDNPDAEVHFYDTGHFALETHHQEIAATIRAFLERKLTQRLGAGLAG